ncbi:LysR family transcriptional regulator [Methylopila sp. Yamaguchi]|uniref:LysR family transcriptional regulator n=1 Tax=Methylopila sp. Yamaguchi TaxID=1437817 RepID=UPI000CAB03A8|nr:LysR substrate-binding domain-containing protein [Methylopila sp. Yamaguchi]GBD48842.1 LysR family transcriptional regulator [Methylopila sp. Yamaguchi]
MDLRQLRYFVQVAEIGNISRAAEVLRVAQPSLSQQIRNLEEELGVDLLVRHARGVTPTELGQRFWDRARRILEEADRAKDDLRSLAESPSGRISVGLPTSAARGLALPLYQAAAERLPKISLHVVEAMSGYLDELIQAGRLDVALLYDHKAFENVAWTEMMVEDLMLFAPAGHPILQQESIPFERLFELPLVLPGRPNVLRTVIEQLAARHEVTPRAIDCDSLPAIAKMVVSAGFFAVMPNFAFADELARGELETVRIVRPTPSWRLSVVVSKRTLNMRGADLTARLMADVIADLVKSGVWKARLTSAERLAAK